MILGQTQVELMEGFAKNWRKSERQPKEDIQPCFE